MKRKKIIIFNIVSYLKVPGGAQQSIEECINFLSKKYKIIFVTLCTKDRNEIDYSAYKFYKNNIRRYEIMISKSNLIFIPFQFLKIGYSLLKFKPDILWAHHPIPYLFYKLLFPFTESIMTFHGPFRKEMVLNNENSIKVFIYRIFFWISSRISKIHYDTKYTALSVQKELDFLKNYERNYFVGPALINPFIYRRKIEEYKNNKKSHKDESFILIPRRLEHRTGVYQFLEMINRPSLKRHIRNNFIITGSGKDFNLISKFKTNNINYEITGFIPYLELIEKILKCKYLIIPSIDAEGYCLPARIAYIIGKPLVSTAIGGIPEAYPDKKGIFKYTDFNSFLEAHEKAIQFNLKEEDLLKRQSDAKKEFMNNLDFILLKKN